MRLNGQRSADDWRESIRARTALARLELAQRTREQWAKQTVDAWRIRFADLYERMVGVPPTAHDALRAALEQVRDGGGGTVEDTVQHIRQQFQLNGGFRGSASD